MRVRRTWRRRSTVEVAGTLDRANTAIARLEQTRRVVWLEQVTGWCTHPDTTVVTQPAIDLAGGSHTDAYEIPDRILDQVILPDHRRVLARDATRQTHPPLPLTHGPPRPSGPTEPPKLTGGGYALMPLVAAIRHDRSTLSGSTELVPRGDPVERGNVPREGST